MNTFNETNYILSLIEEGKNVAISAFAGCGKTTMLETIARTYPEKNILYVCFNKANAEEAKTRFPENVTATTFNSLAWREIVKHKFSQIGKRLKPSWNMNELHEYFFKSPDIEENNFSFLFEVRNMLDSYYTSNKTLLEVFEEQGEALFKSFHHLVGFVEAIETKLTITHDVYCKLYAEKIPELHYDLILVDEVQDMNPIFLQVIEQQLTVHPDKQIIAVGDPYQAIYAFRGAVNAFSFFEKTNFSAATLSTSYRFPQDIADRASSILAKLGENRRIIAYKSLNEAPNAQDEIPPTAYISRTNFELFTHAIDFIENNPYVKINLLVDFSSIFKQLYHIDAIYNGNLPRFPAPGLLKEVRTKKQLEILSKQDEDIKSLIALLIKFKEKGGVTSVKKLLENSIDENSQITFCTGHKSKGFEWDYVHILPEIYKHIKKEEEKAINDPTYKVDPQIYHLLYIMVTRAKIYCNY